MEQKHKYIISREDLLQDPVTLITEGLLIGRLRECELLLNHPSVSRAQAGIKHIDGNYYIFSLRPSNPVLLNGKAVEQNEALAAVDLLEVGPFVLEIDTTEDALIIKVSLRIGTAIEGTDFSSASLTTTRLSDAQAAAGKRATKPRAAPLPGNKALDIFWDKRIREAGKMMRHSKLFPRSLRRAGKSQFIWMPTTDLGSRWPASLFIWGTVAVSLLCIVAAYRYTSAYAPAPLAEAHAKSRLDRFPPIASRANSGACTSCHSLRSNMEANCAGCHNAEAFVATVTKPHRDAGIGCVSCHAEHRGADFKAARAALVTCTECHNDANSALYRGKRVGTPHDGTFGYPVVDGKWKWVGLDDSEWSLKKIAITRLPNESEESWRSKQFHALHVQRVLTVAPLVGNAQGELSCSSCHKTFDPLDRVTPRTTCFVCHSEKTSNSAQVATGKPNCTSCHVQHVHDKRIQNTDLITHSGSAL